MNITQPALTLIPLSLITLLLRQIVVTLKPIALYYEREMAAPSNAGELVGKTIEMALMAGIEPEELIRELTTVRAKGWSYHFELGDEQ